MHLPEYLTAEIFSFFLVFCRVGTCLMLLPGFGSSYVPARIRLLLGLAISLIITPSITSFPAISSNPAILLYQIFAEIVIGLMIGSVAKTIYSALHTGGMILGTQAGLGQAMLFDPNQSAQTSLFSNFMDLMFVALLFSLNLHHFMIYGIVESYSTFPPVPEIPFDSFAKLAATKVAESFAIGVQLAAPLIIVGVIINLASGLLSRLMPSLQVFFIILPAQILLAIFVFAVTLSATMMWFIDAFTNSLTTYLSF